MQGPTAALTATIIVVALLIIAAFVWYHYTGWQTFSFKTGDNPSWLPANQADISRLRFKDCVFTVNRGDGVSKTQDVTPVLNGMAVAYKGGTSNPMSLTLTRPLNPFSFVIQGFNDSATVSDPTKPPWCTSPPPACNSDSACPMPVAGACSVEQSGTCSPACTANQTCVNGVCVAQGVCFSCPGGATVTLAGKWRTI